MAIVPFRVSGRAADQSLEARTFQLGGFVLNIRQAPEASGSLRPLTCAGEGNDSVDGIERGKSWHLNCGGLMRWHAKVCAPFQRGAIYALWPCGPKGCESKIPLVECHNHQQWLSTSYGNRAALVAQPTLQDVPRFLTQ